MAMGRSDCEVLRMKLFANSLYNKYNNCTLTARPPGSQYSSHSAPPEIYDSKLSHGNASILYRERKYSSAG